MKKNKNVPSGTGTFGTRGITLIALIITIIILVILAGVALSQLTGNGIFEKVKRAKAESENAQILENELLAEYEEQISTQGEYKTITNNDFNKVLNTKGNTTLKDKNGNKIVLPAGFKIVVNEDTNNAITVDKGIVVEDATVDESGNPTLTNGSQFVWIPVGTVKKMDETTVNIELNRYEFADGTASYKDSEGNILGIGEPIAKGDGALISGVMEYRELEGINQDGTTEKGNMPAKSISDFISSVNKNGGYYIGRYEARKTTGINSDGNTVTQITEKGTDFVYNYVTQIQASNICRNMYAENNPFTSDLINSYSWDTATLFIQKCGSNSTYSRQTPIYSGYASYGTNKLENNSLIDVQCNIYDMASNTFEWITEAGYGSGLPFTLIGGSYLRTNYYTSFRNGNRNRSPEAYDGFRPIIYLK